MGNRMSNLLRVGIIGLGSRWAKHYKPALLNMSERFQIRVVCDHVQERALSEARQLACACAAGPTELLARDDVDALLLLGRQWYRLWPLELACKLGKPVYCSSSLEEDDVHADALQRQIQQAGISVMLGLSPRFAPATLRLKDLLASRLGAPRLLLCETSQRQSMRQPKVNSRPPSRFLGSASIALVDWCLWLLDSKPLQVQATGLDDLTWSTFLLECADDKGIQITRHRGPGVRRNLRLQVVAQRGSATVELPDQLSWSGAHSEHCQKMLGQRPLAEVLLEHFWQVVRGGATPEPSFGDAYRALGLLRAATRSRAEGRRISVTS
jgi:predicted dehydrogenase